MNPDSVAMAVKQGGEGAPAMSPASLRAILAGALGNVLEWYDFSAYGYMATMFARNFFPAGDEVANLLSVFGIFAASFVVRPLGGIVFGHVGDRHGRRAALLLSVALMGLSTGAIGLLPTYANIGLLAPALLLGMRLLQGLSIGGEFTTSAIYLAEQARPRWRGLVTSYALIGGAAGLLLGSGATALVASLMSPEDLAAWGWRLPFLAGAVLSVGTLLLRRAEVREAVPTAARDRAPIVAAFATDGWNILRAALLNAMLGAGFYVLFVYLATYVQQVDAMPARLALQANTASLFLLLLLLPFFAAVSDMVGRKALLVGALGGFIVLAWPLFAMLSSGETEKVILAQMIFTVLIAAYDAPMPVVLVEMFRRGTRCSAMSIGYNLAIGLAGGTAPMISVYLVSRLHNDMGPALYLIGLSVISLGAALTLSDRARQPLP